MSKNTVEKIRSGAGYTVSLVLIAATANFAWSPSPMCDTYNKAGRHCSVTEQQTGAMILLAAAFVLAVLTIKILKATKKVRVAP